MLSIPTTKFNVFSRFFPSLICGPLFNAFASLTFQSSSYSLSSLSSSENCFSFKFSTNSTYAKQLSKLCIVQLALRIDFPSHYYVFVFFQAPWHPPKLIECPENPDELMFKKADKKLWSLFHVKCLNNEKWISIVDFM